MMAYQSISVRVGNVDEQNMKVSQVGGEGEVGSSIQPMWRRREGKECLLPQLNPSFILTLGGELARHEWNKTTKRERRRGWQGEDHLTSCKRERCKKETSLHYINERK